MNLFAKAALAATISLVALSANPAQAQRNRDKDKDAAPAAAAGPIIAQGIAVASLQKAIVDTDAFRLAQQQRPVTYKQNLDAAEARTKALEAQLKPMDERFEAARAAATTPAQRQALQTQAQTIQQLQERGRQEIQQQLLPVALSEEYVYVLVQEWLVGAVRQAMAKKNISLVLQPNATIARSTAYDLTDEITAELNVLIPISLLVPPQGWRPREMREAQAAQQAAASGGAPASAAGTTPAPAPRPVTPAGPQPEGR